MTDRLFLTEASTRLLTREDRRSARASLSRDMGLSFTTRHRLAVVEQLLGAIMSV